MRFNIVKIGCYHILLLYMEDKCAWYTYFGRMYAILDQSIGICALSIVKIGCYHILLLYLEKNVHGIPI